MSGLPDRLVPIASQTGGPNMRRIIEAPGEWGLMISATGEHNLRGLPDDRMVAIDNGVVTSCNRAAKEAGLERFDMLEPEAMRDASRLGWDPTPFKKVVERFGARASWVVLPDIIAGGHESLGRSLAWAQWCLDRVERVLVPVQDGMDPARVGEHLGDRVGIFVGGSTEFKEQTSGPVWGALSRSRGCWLHVGRVNTCRRIFICQDAGAHSFDGTSVSIFGQKTMRKLDGAARQTHMFGERAR